MVEMGLEILGNLAFAFSIRYKYESDTSPLYQEAAFNEHMHFAALPDVDLQNLLGASLKIHKCFFGKIILYSHPLRLDPVSRRQQQSSQELVVHNQGVCSQEKLVSFSA